MNLGWTEILLIGGIALLVFGPNKLPSLGKSMGEAIRGFKKGITEEPEKDAKPQITQNPAESLNQQEESEKEKNKNS